MDKPTLAFTPHWLALTQSQLATQSVLLGPAYNWNWHFRTCTLHLPTHTHTHTRSPAPATAPSRPCCWSWCLCCYCCLLFPATDALGETATLQRWNGKEGLDGGVAEKG